MGPQFCSGRRRPCRAGAAPGRSRGSRPPPEPPLPPPPPRGAARAPVRVRPASMAFLTAWKGAASGKRDRRYQAGRGLGGRRGPGGGGGWGTAEGTQREPAVCGGRARATAEGPGRGVQPSRAACARCSRLRAPSRAGPGEEGRTNWFHRARLREPQRVDHLRGAGCLVCAAAVSLRDAAHAPVPPQLRMSLDVAHRVP